MPPSSKRSIRTNRRIGAVVVPIGDELVGKTRLQLLVLMGAAGAVLLIACANLASLLLSRAVGRRGELGIRAALGAQPGRLVRQLLVEALLLSTIGGDCLACSLRLPVSRL